MRTLAILFFLASTAATPARGHIASLSDASEAADRASVADHARDCLDSNDHITTPNTHAR